MTLVNEKQSDVNPYPVFSSQTKNNGLAGFYKDYLYEDAITWTTDGANAGDVNYRKGKFYCTNVCGVLINKNGYANKCVAELINTVAKKYVSYVGNPKLMNGVMSQIKIPVPSILEQQKIASCLSSVDEVIAAQSQNLDVLKNHKKGLMQNLFPKEGEKVPKYRFKEFEKDGEWIEKKLGEVTELTSSKRVHLADYVPSGVPFFRGKEISQLKNNQMPDDILYISNEQYKEIKDKYGVPKKGDILITAVGTLGNVLCIKNDDEFYFKDGNLIWMKNILIDSHFLEVLLDVGKEKVLASAIGSSQKALTMAALNNLEFHIPSNPKEQQKIASCLSSLDALITAQAEKIEQLQLHKKGLMQGLFPKIND
jgi:type I restriction enzyme S subunit